MKEIWAPVIQALNYEVSNLGRVRRSMNADPTVNTFNGKLLKPDFSTGYDRVSLRKDGKLIRALVHRLVAEAFLPPARKFAHVNHIDGNKRNNRIDNLEWSSPQHNVHHAWRTGLCRPNSGEKHGMAKLNERDVDRIREARSRGVSLSILALVFNVTEAAVSMADRGASWKHTINN